MAKLYGSCTGGCFDGKPIEFAGEAKGPMTMPELIGLIDRANETSKAAREARESSDELRRQAWDIGEEADRLDGLARDLRMKVIEELFPRS